MSPNITEQDRQHHNRIAGNYDSWYVNPLQYQLLHGELVEDVTRAFGPKGGMLIDLGAGTGATAIPLHQQGYKVLAVDSSDGMLAVLKAKAPDLQTLAADINIPLPLEAGSVGCVVISQMLHHLPDHRAVLVEVKRLLRSGGRLCIFEPQKLPRTFEFLRVWARETFSTGDHTEAEEPIQPDDLRKMLKEIGFKEVSCRRAFFMPFNPKWGVLRWLERHLWRVPGHIPLISRLGGVVKIVVEKP